MKKNLPLTILQAALLVGTLDGLAGMLLYYRATGRNPLGVFPYIASGVFGKAAFTGDDLMLVAGVLFHYFIAFCFTVFFFWLYLRWRGLRQQKVLVGVLYGLFVWAVMNLLVVPLSNVQRGPFNVVNAVINAVVLIGAIGLPLSLIAGRLYTRRFSRTS